VSGLNLDPHAYHTLLTSPLFILTLTLGAYQVGVFIYRRARSFPLLHPSLVGALLVALLLPLLHIDYAQYVAGTQLLQLLLGTATVALAIPLYQQLPLMRALALPIVLTTVFGACFGALSAVSIAWALDGSAETLRSLAAKSVTTPIAIGISREIGGVTALTNGAVLFTAAVGITAAPFCFRLLRIEDARIQGFVLGIAAHGMATARAFETSAMAGAFASLSLCLTGTFSSVVIPLAARWLW
jgi:putative effector of murein hydrolase